MSLDAPVPIAGVDGCKRGWVAVVAMPDALPAVSVVPRLVDLMDRLPGDAIIAVDMPIGLPDRTSHGGRGPERAVRPLLGVRQSSVFSIPSRRAVHAAVDPFSTLDKWYADHRLASAAARATSDPPRGVSIQAFGIFEKIREVDALLLDRPALRDRVFESHPEVAFWRLNGGQAMSLPKKVKGKVNPAGMEERRALLVRHGLDPALLAVVPPGVGEDDLLDAAAMLAIAARIARGVAAPFPDPPEVDAQGMRMAIWA